PLLAAEPVRGRPRPALAGQAARAGLPGRPRRRGPVEQGSAGAGPAAGGRRCDVGPLPRRLPPPHRLRARRVPNTRSGGHIAPGGVTTHMAIPREGYVFIAAASVVALVGFAVAAVAGSWVVWVASYIAVIFALAFAFFFRDPEREGERGAHLILAPADGKIVQ